MQDEEPINEYVPDVQDVGTDVPEDGHSYPIKFKWLIFEILKINLFK